MKLIEVKKKEALCTHDMKCRHTISQLTENLMSMFSRTKNDSFIKEKDENAPKFKRETKLKNA